MTSTRNQQTIRIISSKRDKRDSRKKLKSFLLYIKGVPRKFPLESVNPKES